MKAAQPMKLLAISAVGVLLLLFQFSPAGAILQKLSWGSQETTPLTGKQALLVEQAPAQPSDSSQINPADSRTLTAMGDPLAPAAQAAITSSTGEAATNETLAEVQTQPGEVSPAVFALEGAGTSEFKDFVKRVSNGKAEAVRGIYAQGVFKLPVVQQPGSNPAFVSEQKDAATQFQSAAEYGVTGLLAHNFLSGLKFYNLHVGQIVRVIYGDSSIRSYQITELVQYQKLSPSNLRSDLIDLSTGEQVTSETVFARVYRGKHHLTLQTCLERDGVSNWGLSFWIATPVDAGF